MGQIPTPFFPGQTYADPSAPTQYGINMGMGAMPIYQQAAGMGQGIADAYSGAAQGMDQAAGAMGQSSPYYQQAAQFGANAAPQWGQAGAAYGQQHPMYQQAAGMGLGAIGGQRGILGTSGGNYNFLSNAADVANNPYVQQQLGANKDAVMTALKEEMLPAANQGAAQVNALGGSRHGLAQGTAMGKAADALAQANAQTMLGAYGQGLGAQQHALSNTGAMLQNQLAPAQAASWAAGQQGLGAQALQNRALMGQQQMNQYGAAGNWATRGAQSLADAARLRGEGAGYLGRGQNALAGSARMLNEGALQALGYGDRIQGFHQQVINDRMARHAHQFSEPWQRMQNVQGILPAFQPYATTQGYGGNMTTAPNPKYMNPIQAGIGGAGLGLGLYNMYNQYRNQQKGGK
jgi:hypothetical protein